MVNRDAAWDSLMTLSNFGAGNSKSNSLYWAATRAAPVPGFNLSAVSTSGSSSYNSGSSGSSGGSGGGGKDGKGGNSVSGFTLPSACAANSACDAIGTCLR